VRAERVWGTKDRGVLGCANKGEAQAAEWWCGPLLGAEPRSSGGVDPWERCGPLQQRRPGPLGAARTPAAAAAWTPRSGVTPYNSGGVAP